MTLRHTKRFHFPPSSRRRSSLCHWGACPRLRTSGSWAKGFIPSSRSKSYPIHIVLVTHSSIHSSVYARCDSSHGKRVSRRWIRREPTSSPACCSSWTCTRSFPSSSYPTWCVERVARAAACTRSPAPGCSRCRSSGIASRKRKGCSIVPTVPSQSTAFRLATTRAASTCSAGAHYMLHSASPAWPDALPRSRQPNTLDLNVVGTGSQRARTKFSLQPTARSTSASSSR